MRGLEPNRVGDFKKLDHVEPTLAALVFGDERLGPAKPCRDGGLRQASLSTRLDQKDAQGCVFARESGA